MDEFVSDEEGSSLDDNFQLNQVEEDSEYNHSIESDDENSENS
jgi:hypothetical protein